MNIKLKEKPIQYLRGVGPARAALMAKLGVESVEDLLWLFPRRYEDRRNVVPLSEISAGETQTVIANIFRIQSRRTLQRKYITQATLEDGTGRISCIWFNQPYLKSYLKAGAKVVLFGRVETYQGRLQMVAPEFELLDEEDSSQQKRIVPVYPLTKGLTQSTLRRIVQLAINEYLDEFEDVLPIYIRNKHRLMNVRHSLKMMHTPESFEGQSEALRRISFEEFFFFQIAVLLRRQYFTNQLGVVHKMKDQDVLKYTSALPFAMTNAQKRVIREMRQDMAQPQPMLRLLQGDVGSGKTVVAFWGCYNSILNGHQAAVMAPTEILARQHYENCLKLFTNKLLPNVRVGLLVSGMGAKEYKKVQADIADGQIDLLVGTHALISEKVMFKDLTFVVVDEQHKFGVKQRALLSSKGRYPDALIMTATPIPRTLCLTLYGDLEVSVMDELPPGRGQVHTYHYGLNQAKAVNILIKEKLQEGRQVYIVFPIIEDSEKLDLKAAETMYDRYQQKDFKDFRVGLLHGQMKQDQVIETMTRFKNHEIDILVATTVLEVGVDVANASVMVIEHADRFGLAQLHQLRGRIGRGKHDGHCVLVADPKTADGQRRIEAAVATTNGFEIAQKDLEIRGPGHYFGHCQHGFSDLNIINPLQQMDVLELSRQEAQHIFEQDAELKQKQHKELKSVVQKRYPKYLKMMAGG